MNNSHSTKPQSASPSTGIRHRIGQVVRWHAEPVISEEYRAEISQPRDGRGRSLQGQPM